MSYFLVTSSLPRSNTNTEFRTWGSQIANAIANCGIVQSSGVGTQIDWSTVASPSGAGQSQGYEIYQFNDALQNTAPVYFKIEYGSGNALQTPALYFTLGTGANSSGNITGNLIARFSINSTANNSSFTNIYAGAAGRLSMFLWTEAGQAGILFGIERTLNSNGEPTGNGVACMWARSGTRRQVLWTPTTGNVTAFETTFGVLTPTSTGRYANTLTHHLAVYPIFFDHGPTRYPHQTMFVVGAAQDMALGTVTYFPMYGANVPYYWTTNNSIDTVSPRAGSKSVLLVRAD